MSTNPKTVEESLRALMKLPRHRRKITHIEVTPESYANGVWKTKTDVRDVRLFCFEGRWAMVARPRCMPYVCEIKELLP